MIDKAFKQFVEDSDYPAQGSIIAKVGPLDGIPAADDDIKAPFQLTKDNEMLERVNAWLSSVVTRPYMNPHTVMGIIKQKLATASVDFDAPVFTGAYGNDLKPLKQFGHPTSFNLDVHWVLTKGWYTLNVQILGSVVPEVNFNERSGEDKSDISGSRILDETWNSKKTIGHHRTLSGHGYALKHTLPDGTQVYTHSQGHKIHIHQHAQRGLSFTALDPSGKQLMKANGSHNLHKLLRRIHKK